MRPAEHRGLDPCQRVEMAHRVGRLLHVGDAQVAHAFRAEQRHVDPRAECHQERRGAADRPCLFSGPVEDPVEQGVPGVGALTRHLCAQDADHQHRQRVHELVLVPAGEDAEPRTTARHGQPERLAVTAGDVRAVLTRRCQHAERRRIDAHDDERALVVGDAADLLGPGLHDTEVARVLDVHRCGLLGNLRAQLVEVHRPGDGVVPDISDVEPGADVVEHHLQPVRVDVLRQHELSSPGDARGHLERVAAGGRAVVHGRSDHVHVEQVAHHGLVLEHGHETAVVGDLDPRISGQELRTPHDL